MDRVHLLTRKDLNNIEASFDLSSDIVKHKNDAITVDAWVESMTMSDTPNSCVLYYKRQGYLCDTQPRLSKDDFVLVIMNTAQADFLKKYGNDCICIDSTHGVNGYGFELSTVLVLDDMRQGFPCAFLISNRSDQFIIHYFLHI